MNCISDESKLLERDSEKKEVEGNITWDDIELSKNDSNNIQKYSVPRIQSRPPSLKIPHNY